MNVYCLQSGFHMKVLEHILSNCDNVDGIAIVKGKRTQSTIDLGFFHDKKIKVCYVDGKFIFLFFFLFRCFSFLFDKFYISDFKSIYYNFLVAGLDKKKVFFFDDGASSISLLNLYLKKGKVPFLNGGKNMPLFKQLFLKIFGVSVRDVPFKFESFYTIFPVFGDNIINLNLNSSVGIACDIDKGSVVFLGGPYIEKGIMTKEIYFEAIKDALALSYNKAFYYIPHRAENDENIANVQKLSTNIQVLNVNGGVEDFYLKKRVVPFQFYSMYSTALFTLPVYFCAIKCFCRFVSDDFLIEEHRQAISSTYKLLRESNNVEFY